MDTREETVKPQTPMEVAGEYVQLTREKRDLDRQLLEKKNRLEELEPRILELIETEQLPVSFKKDGASVFTREQIWASPLDGDHGALSEALSECGLTEYLPNRVNSQSISAYVREHVNEVGEVEGLDPRLMARLKITKTVKAVVNG